MISVVTTFSPKGYAVYGRSMIATFLENWPANVRLHVYYEGEKPADADDGAVWVALDDDKDRECFLSKHKDREDIPGDYRFRVARYSHKVWAQTAVPRDCRYIVWLDADCETLNKVTPEIIAELLPPTGKCVSYLGRPYFRHSETGFIAYDLNCGGADFLTEFRRMYESGDVLNLPEWHDCMVFDFVRRKMERAGYRFHNLCPDAHGLEVFEQSPLAKIVRHNKGPKRKEKVYGDSMMSMEEV